MLTFEGFKLSNLQISVFQSMISRHMMVCRNISKYYIGLYLSKEELLLIEHILSTIYEIICKIRLNIIN